MNVTLFFVEKPFSSGSVLAKQHFHLFDDLFFRFAKTLIEKTNLGL